MALKTETSVLIIKSKILEELNIIKFDSYILLLITEVSGRCKKNRFSRDLDSIDPRPEKDKREKMREVVTWLKMMRNFTAT